MILAKNGIIPPQDWMHNYNIIDNNNKTLKYYLENNQLPVPYHWNNNDMTIFDKTCYEEIP